MSGVEYLLGLELTMCSYQLHISLVYRLDTHGQGGNGIVLTAVAKLKGSLLNGGLSQETLDVRLSSISQN